MSGVRKGSWSAAGGILNPPMILCPKCDRPIPPDNINIAADTALCRACGAVTAVSAVVRGAAASSPVSAALPSPRAAFDPASPPAGAWYRDDGVETVIGATTRSGIAVFLVPFVVVWTCALVGGVFGSQIASGKFDAMTSVVGVFLAIAGTIIGSFALMTVCGRVEVRLRQGTGEVFVGVGVIGWRRRFDAAGVRTIREDWAGWSSGKRPRKAIFVEGAERVVFGSMLNEGRRYFVMEAMKRALRLG